MSKRFGRNQKRAMRLQLQQKDNLIEKQVESMQLLKNDLSHANHVINLTADILGEYFVSLPVKTTEVEEIQERYQFCLKRPHHEFNYDRVSMKMNMLEYTLDYLDTYQASTYTDELRSMIHLRYRSINGEVAYGFTDKAWTMLSEHHLVPLKTKFIAEEMAKHLTKERKTKGNSRYNTIWP